jgi:hypothetical protein
MNTMLMKELKKNLKIILFKFIYIIIKIIIHIIIYESYEEIKYNFIEQNNECNICYEFFFEKFTCKTSGGIEM